MPDNAKYRVLCTRPLSGNLITEAGEQGIAIDVQDFIQIKPLINNDLLGDENMMRIFGHDTDTPLVFTSAHAVRVFTKYYLHQYATFYIIANPICCIDGNTKKLLQQKLPNNKILAEASYGKDLAAAIIALGNINEVHFFCGNQRRDELPRSLRDAGITVNEYVIYENIPTPTLVADEYDGILFFSPSAVKSYFSANRLPLKTVCFAIGRTTATLLREYTDNKIIMSPATGEDYMVKTAIFYFNNINCYE
ncbi:uroporphyrinogen-III synthase [Chitinophaga sp. G-6-1-13]|uniref:Uroporphyrinogen-III synthase n=1 Tax=Chitinophaga fulva TaxID=2728842 RepID=A0A848GTU3_9BACT|nr:uroporphyrinogen-III synthase [Chitinophaga fulva]NML41774.1 uroporphyrinogen-III synthase [Chitinophaga fulva]